MLNCDVCRKFVSGVKARCRLDTPRLRRHLFLCENCWQAVVLAFAARPSR